MTRRILPALALAVLVAAPFAVPEVGGIATWKIVLALLGLVLFVAGGRVGRGTDA